MICAEVLDADAIAQFMLASDAGARSPTTPPMSLMATLEMAVAAATWM
jgi:hypothetical protein